MRVKIGKNRIVLTGKAWEIQALLKKYAKQHEFVTDWLNSCTIIE